MEDNERPTGEALSSVTSPQNTRRNSNAEPMTQSCNDLPPRDTLESVRRRPRTLDNFRHDGETTGQALTTSLDPSRPSLPRRPTVSRLGSIRQVSQRSHGFSVDDASREVEADAAEHRQARTSGSLRRQPSTLRRRPTVQTRIGLPETMESEEDSGQNSGNIPSDTDAAKISIEEEATDEGQSDENADEEDEADLSDAESFTLKDRQEAINETHPFGIRIWKPALYKKSRSVDKNAEGDIHSSPGGGVSRWLLLFNFAWTLLFGWWLALVAAIGGLLCYIFTVAPGCAEYGRILWGLSLYLFYPFGKYVKLIQQEEYAEEDQGEGRSISEYEQWQSGDIEEGRLFFGPVRPLVGRRSTDVASEEEDETASLIARVGRGHPDNITGAKSKNRLFGRGEWNIGRIIFFLFFYGLLTPLLLIVSGICWLLIFTIPMGRVTLILLYHLRRHPLALEFHSDSTYTRGPGAAPSSILLCTYRAVGTKYWKYTIDGTNIMLINLLGVVAFVIFDYWVLSVAFGLKIALTNTIVIFLLALFSVIPLAYFIGQAVASISAQSSMGVGAAINAFFSTLVEVYLYCVALNDGKAKLVEGSVIGSIFAGILLLPGLSMCFGALKRKTQRFNVKSAGVTSTMLLFAMIGAFGPTLFYQIYGAHELTCYQCSVDRNDTVAGECRRCFFAQIPAVDDPFYTMAVQPFIWFAAVLLFLSYIIGLVFTLRTHAATIWNNELDEKKIEKMDFMAQRVNPASVGINPPSIDYGTNTLSRQSTRVDIRDSQLYKSILGQSLKQAGLTHPTIAHGPDGKQTLNSSKTSPSAPANPPINQTAGTVNKRGPNLKVRGLTEEENQAIVRQMAEMAATAAAVAARDGTQDPRKAAMMGKTAAFGEPMHPTISHTGGGEGPEVVVAGEAAGGGHVAPNWSRTKSYFVLLTATIAYGIIADILVRTVDAVLSNVDIDEKFLGITLFALVPNTTEFLNAISFAMNGNIALSMEIGSAYALQVCLLQIPALVLFSAIFGNFVDPRDAVNHTFTLLFPQWDMVTVILCVFLLSYMYGEGKSNYFKGSILILSYLVVVVGFYFAGFSPREVSSPIGLDRFEASSARFGMMGGRGMAVGG